MHLNWHGIESTKLYDGTAYTGLEIEQTSRGWQVVEHGRYVYKTGLPSYEKAQLWAQSFYKASKES